MWYNNRQKAKAIKSPTTPEERKLCDRKATVTYMNFDLHTQAKEKILIVAHRGTFAGNIPCNILPAFETALLQGADMVELDVDMTVDGKLVVFHPGMEWSHLGIQTRVADMPWEEVSRLRYVNYDRVPTQFGLNTFDEVLEALKGRCFINVDKFWGHPKEIYEAIKRHGMTDQVLVKSSVREEVLAVLSELAPELPFMPIVRDTHPMHETLMKSGLNYIGAEVLFADESAEVASEAFIDRMHRDGKLLWANSIIYDCKVQLTAGHSDDCAICGDPASGWGWLAKRGFDIIQTDWPIMVNTYLDAYGLLYKKRR